MKKTVITVVVLLITCFSAGCGLPSLITFSENEMINPGDKIGEMTLEQGDQALPYPSIWYFCEIMPDELEPTKSSSDCEVPQMSGIAIEIGWFAKETRLEANWEAIEWSLTIDGNPIDLEAFEWTETKFIAHGEDNKSRVWILNLKDLSPGRHKLKLQEMMRQAVDDGFDVYQPGLHQHTVDFSIVEKTEYPGLSSTITPGQHPYTSLKSGMDFLLFLPDEYGRNPQQEWPTILYLHGAHLRGATLELLRTEEPLPRKLENEEDFPFIVLSPLGDGGYEFWTKDEMIKPLFVLLEEIQNILSIDPKRIYFTGNDMGGNGVWAIGLQYPDYFAALVPVAGYFSYPFEIPENICDLRGVPVRAYHGERDPFVPAEVEQSLVDVLNACGGIAEIILSPDMRNDVPYKVYADPELYEWFLSHSRE